MMSKRLL